MILKCCHGVIEIRVQGIKKLETNRHSSSISLTTDETMGNHVVRGTRDQAGTRKPPLLKRATVGDEEILRRAGWTPSDIKREAIRPFSVCSLISYYGETNNSHSCDCGECLLLPCTYAPFATFA